MLSKGDEYPLHQTPEPMAVSGGNRNFYDAILGQDGISIRSRSPATI